MDEYRESKSLKERKQARKKWKEEKVMKLLNKTTKDGEDDSEAQGSVTKKPKLEETEPVQYERGNTVSIAVPGSILDNAQSPELRTYLAGQIARAACIFQIDEIVVFDDLGEEEGSSTDEGYLKETSPCCLQLARILQYLECPQYLRKHLFPLHKDLQYAGILNPLDAPHHFRQKDATIYREGVIANRPIKPGRGSLVNVGLEKDVSIKQVLQPGTRVTIRLECEDASSTEDGGQGRSKKLKGHVVPPWQPRAHLGKYWGYQVRVASSISAALSECPFQGMYDLIIGTSDKGSKDIPEIIPPAKHIIILFGGLQGLEVALENNGGRLYKSVDGDMSNICDLYLNTCANQGSRTIRTEEALLISLTVLMPRMGFKISEQFP